MIKLLEILLLVIPAVAWKLWRDRNGTIHPNKEPVTVFIVMNTCVGIVTGLNYGWFENGTLAWIFAFKCFLVSIAGYALLFPYAFNWYWFSKYFYGSFENRLYYTLTHLSKTAWPDKMPLWIKIGWFGRLITYIILFSLSIYWFLNT